DRLKFRIDTDITETNLKILDALTPEATASLQKDIKKGGKTEIEGLIFDVVRIGENISVNTPNYNMIAEYFEYKKRINYIFHKSRANLNHLYPKGLKDTGLYYQHFLAKKFDNTKKDTKKKPR
ncbi:MAG: hypothetical protein JJE49_03070, partial [Peptostreptococcaceae bacterium]|nr:hypothetical protein [Peptostreptococcaceae bacterium]